MQFLYDNKETMQIWACCLLCLMWCLIFSCHFAPWMLRCHPAFCANLSAVSAMKIMCFTSTSCDHCTIIGICLWFPWGSFWARLFKVSCSRSYKTCLILKLLWMQVSCLRYKVCPKQHACCTPAYFLANLSLRGVERQLSKPECLPSFLNRPEKLAPVSSTYWASCVKF